MSARLIHPESFVRALNSINVTPKSATLLVLGEDRLTGPGIYEKLSLLMGTSQGLPAKPAFRSYCLLSLVPEGFVIAEKEKRKKGDVTHFRPTVEGNLLGQGAAALALDWEYTHRTSLSSLLGSTSAPGESTGPENRAHYLLELDRQKVMTMLEIENRLGLNGQIVWRHTNHFVSQGLVECTKAKRDKQVRLTDKGREFMGSFLYPLLAATQSHADLEDLYDTSQVLMNDVFLRPTLRRAFAVYERESMRIGRAPNRTLAERTIKEVIASNPGITPKQLVKLTRVGNPFHYLPNLIRREEIRRDNGHYFITEKS